jgi:hypothetical protein
MNTLMRWLLVAVLALSLAVRRAATSPVHATTNRTVTNCASGAALQSAVQAAVGGGGGTVSFACAGAGPFTITLTATLQVSGGVAVIIDGSDGGKNGVTLDGGGTVRPHMHQAKKRTGGLILHHVDIEVFAGSKEPSDDHRSRVDYPPADLVHQRS